METFWLLGYTEDALEDEDDVRDQVDGPPIVSRPAWPEKSQISSEKNKMAAPPYSDVNASHYKCTVITEKTEPDMDLATTDGKDIAKKDSADSGLDFHQEGDTAAQKGGNPQTGMPGKDAGNGDSCPWPRARIRNRRHRGSRQIDRLRQEYLARIEY